MKVQELLPNFEDLLLDAVFLVNEGGSVVYVSAACERIFGYAPEEMIGRSMIDLIVPEDRAKTLEEAGRVMAGHPRIGFENRYFRKDGSHVHIMWSARWSETDRLRIGVARDITARKRAEAVQAALYAVSEAAHESTELPDLCRAIHGIVASHMPIAEFAVATCDPKSGRPDFAYQSGAHGKARLTRPATARQYCAEAIRRGETVLLPDRANALVADVAAPCVGSAFWLATPLMKQEAPIGALALKSLPGTVYTDADKELLRFVAVQVAIVIERRQLNDDLLRSARYDELTGLPNRRSFHDRMSSVLARCQRRGGGMAVLFLDIDNFKHVNDTLGHAVGDLLLQEVARRLARCLRGEDMVARLGGDEFVVVLEEVRTQDEALAVAEKIRKIVRQPMHVDEVILRTRASIGIALYPEHGTDTGQLLRHADKAMYRKKKAAAKAA
jgi:diguanylate cyclase (GGDEF)-like protein/PAS domain S-box-containing protein